MKIENGNMKMQNMKMQNMKMQNMKMQNMKMQNMKMQNMKIQNMKIQNVKMFFCCVASGPPYIIVRIRNIILRIRNMHYTSYRQNYHSFFISTLIFTKMNFGGHFTGVKSPPKFKFANG